MKKLKELYQEHEGKASDKWSLYLDEYERLFSEFRSKPINILEIGVQNGGSLDLWAKYFKNAGKIIGCDINETCRSLEYTDPRISLVIGNAEEHTTKNRILELCTGFDIVIDDGSHKSSDIIKAFSNYFEYVNSEGLFIAEDLHCSYWEELEGGLYDPYSSITFFKYLADIINKEHWGVDKGSRNYLELFERTYGIHFEDSELAKIHSVEFLNSMCIVRKKPENKNKLGQRVIAGQDYSIYKDVADLNSKYNETPDQSANPYSNREKDPILELEDKNELIEILISENNSLRSEIVVLKSENEHLHQSRNWESQKLEDVLEEVNNKNNEVSRLYNIVDEIHNSSSWKVTAPVRWLSKQVRSVNQVGLKNRSKQIFFKLFIPVFSVILNLVKKNPKIKDACLRILSKLGLSSKVFSIVHGFQSNRHDSSGRLSGSVSRDYKLWSEAFDTPNQEDMVYLAKSGPVQSHALVLAKFNNSNAHLSVELVKSLLDSVGQNWTASIIFVDQSSSGYWQSEILEIAEGDSRIQFELPSESYVGPLVLVEPGAKLRPHALRTFIDALSEHEEFKIAYSDEDYLSQDLSATDPWFKPQYSPLLAKQGCLFGRVVAVMSDSEVWRRITRQIEQNDLNLQDLIIPLAEALDRNQIRHVPHVLYHNLFEHPEKLDLEIPELNNLPNVSVVIPTRDRWDLLGPCLESIEKSDWPDEKLDVIVVDNGSAERKTLQMLELWRAKGKIRIIRDDKPFNWSRLNNLAARSSTSDLLIFLNNDTEVDDPLWIRKLASYAVQDTIGAVGCKLLFPDRTVQHGGVIAGIQGVAGHGHLFIGEFDGGYCNLANMTREVSAVTGACLAVEKRKFELIGGFSEEFPVAFNDVVFCFELLKQGLDNIYIPDSLLIHHESKSRGYDDTPEKIALNREAAMLAWSKHSTIMRNDPFYSPNLSLYSPYGYAEAPRRRPVWRKNNKKKVRVLLLSSTHAVGHGVPAVLALQAEYFVSSGFHVVVGGPESDNDFPYPGCERIVVHDPLEAACQAALLGMDVVIPHTPPFFSISRWTGEFPVVVCYDHGEPPAKWFPDSDYRRDLLSEKDMGLTMATYVYAISDAIAAESRTSIDGVITEGNTHLGQWDERAETTRNKFRAENAWEGKFVVLDVCRFHKGERLYKGVDKYADVLKQFKSHYPDNAKDIVFVLCGKGNSDDVHEMERGGLTVFPNVTNEEMYSIYCAADAYLNFSKWEGFNLGIAQALAMGLPTFASDIPAHRAFGIPVSDEKGEASNWLMQELKSEKLRSPKLIPWQESLEKWVKVVREVRSD